MVDAAAIRVGTVVVQADDNGHVQVISYRSHFSQKVNKKLP